MSATGTNDNGEDVNDFLLRIKELGDKRDKEDEERTRKLEEEIIQGRRERQARRAERARSISPTKDSPLSSLGDLHTSLQMTPPPDLRPSPRPDDQQRESAPTKDTEDPIAKSRIVHDRMGDSSKTEKDEENPTGGRTTSWQQRPLSLKFERPSSSSQSPERGGLEESETTSRSQIAQALGSKDPSWFRQTPDRGLGSLALRKNAADTLSDVSSISGSVRLPAFSRESTTEPEKLSNIDIGSERSRSPSRTSSAFGSNSIGQRYSSISSVSTTGGLGSPIPLSASQRPEARKTDLSVSVEELPHSTPGRRSPDRSASPTKGLGGFVQSAMMKRSDSISKRWSAQTAPGLSRGDSIASNRSGLGRPGTGDFSHFGADPHSARENSPLSTSRPGSSHSEATVIQNSKLSGKSEVAEATPDASVPRDDGGFVKPSLPLSKPANSFSSDNTKEREPRPQTPKSPSKEQRRWSPTKASWLESALNRPESPRPKSQVSQPPAWMKDLEKNRQSKTSVDLGKPANFKEVTPLGLMRSPPLGSHYKKPSISGISGIGDVIHTEKASSEATRLPSGDKNNDTEVASPSETMEKPGKDELLSQDESKRPSETDTATQKSPPPVTAPKPNLALRSKPNSPPADPPVPQQPAVADFRSSLRRRDQNAATTAKEEPEFKNVFGKLRKTETAKFVPKDELKDNIVRGKAALNVTGGPKKNQRVDEFKESLLKQKEAMKTGGGTVRKNVENERQSPKSVEAVPEALSMRKNLSKAEPTATDRTSKTSFVSPIENKNSPILPSSENEVRKDNDKPSEDVQNTSSSAAPAKLEKDTGPPSFSPTLNTQPSKGEIEKIETDTKSPSKDSGQQEVTEEKNEPVRDVPFIKRSEAPKPASVSKGAAAKGSLADRLNPSLSNFLSRGPPRPGGDAQANTPAGLPKSSPLNVPASSTAEASKPLTHMTKSRARGPKRRLPAGSNEQRPSSDRPLPILGISKGENKVERGDTGDSPNQPSPMDGPETYTSEKAFATLPVDVNPSSPKPVIAAKSPGLRNTSPSLSTPISRAELPPKPAKEATLEFLPSKRYIDPSAPSQKPLTGISKATSFPPSPKDKPSPPPKSAKSPVVSPNLNRSSGDLPSSSPATPVTQMSSPTDRSSTSAKTGLAFLQNSRPQKPTSPKPKTLPSLPLHGSDSPPVPPKKIGMTVTTAIGPKESDLTSPIPHTSESLRAISAFFNTVPKSSDRVDIDPQLILEMSPDDSKVKTVRHQIWEITGDGRRQDLPGNQQHILYEGSMYLCVHIFEKSGDRKTNVHLWCGDEVGEAAIEDSQLFARKVARENGCKLEILRQGKETPTFIQGLGGILITRRGLSSRSSSSALYMLCGRRHLGQIVFDEVDFTRSQLCSGYPFVISAKFGTLFLWKGKGSGADEIGAARLLGMDLGLTGEMEEVTEGKETASFLEIFPDAQSVGSPLADYWHLKPKHDRYRCRLLRVDHELGQRSSFWNRRGSSSPVTRPNDTVQEIEPFCQKDLHPREIYILDAFFEIYVIVGEQAPHRSAEFASAVVFAQEYGILAVSLQDRPFIPPGFVAIGGVPQNCKTAFRKWDDRAGTAVPRVLPLNAAIEAIRS